MSKHYIDREVSSDDNDVLDNTFLTDKQKRTIKKNVKSKMDSLRNTTSSMASASQMRHKSIPRPRGDATIFKEMSRIELEIDYLSTN